MKLTSFVMCWCALADPPWWAILRLDFVRLSLFVALTPCHASVAKISQRPNQLGWSRHQCGIHSFHLCVLLPNLLMQLPLASCSSSLTLFAAIACRTCLQWSRSSPSRYLYFFCKKINMYCFKGLSIV